METPSALLALCAGNSPVTGEFPAQRPVTRILMFSLICAWINGWVNNREAGNSRRQRTYYDDTVTWKIRFKCRMWIAANTLPKKVCRFQCKEIGKYLQVRRTIYFKNVTVISDVYNSSIPGKIISNKYCFTLSISKLWNSLSKAVPVKISGSGGRNKGKSLQDSVNFHRSLAWRYVHIFNTVLLYAIPFYIGSCRIV